MGFSEWLSSNGRLPGVGGRSSQTERDDSIRYEVVESIDEVDENQWNNVVSQGETGTVFHRTGWLRAIESGLGYQPRHVVVRKKGNPVGLCPNFVSPVELPVDLPVEAAKLGLCQLTSTVPGFGGPVITTDRTEVLEAIIEAVSDVADWSVIGHRMRIFDAASVQYAQALHAASYVPTRLYCRMWLPLDDYQGLLDRMSSGRRREVRKADNSDLEVVEEDIDVGAAKRFYAAYRETLNRIDGGGFPLSFFEALAMHLPERVEIFTARSGGEDVGKHLYLRDDEQESFHYFFSGVAERHFEHSTPTVLHNYAFRWALDNDYSAYDFGGTASDHSNGVFRYKQQFGAEIEPVYEWERRQSIGRWSAYRFSRRQYVRRQVTEAN